MFAQEKGADKVPFVLDAGDLEIKALIDKAAGHLGWNILTNEQELANAAGGNARVTLQTRVVTDDAGCEELLTTLLGTRGFVLTVLDSDKQLYEVISLVGARAREVFATAKMKSVDDVLARPNLRVPVTTVVKLDHINATVANNALRPFFANMGGSPVGSITLGTVGNQSAMLISGMQNQVAGAVRLLQQCDTADAPDPTQVSLQQRIDALGARIAALEQAIAALTKGK